jgi:hypothetical protein
MRLAVRGIALLLCCAGVAAAGQHSFKGRRLDDALRILQADGLRVVFSSEMVKPQMRVQSEPRAGSAREQLDELLGQQGLTAEAGPGGTILVVRRHPAQANASPSRTTSVQPIQKTTPDTGSLPASYSDQITVTSTRDVLVPRGAAPAVLDRRGLSDAGSVFDADGLEAIRAMPGVSAPSDVRSDFSVRGDPFRQIGIVIDGVSTPLLRHALYGRADAGSLPMFGSDSLDHVTLETGAFPRLYGDALGAQLGLSFREGSRDAMRVAGSVGGMTTSVVAEGPIGTEHRGSWIASGRDSYHSWPPGPRSATDPGFVFGDLQTKLVYDVSPRQQISFSALGGHSAMDTLDEVLAGQLTTGTDTAGLATAGWQSTIGNHTIVRQRVYFVGQELATTLKTGEMEARSTNTALGYRAEALRATLGGMLDSGAEIVRQSGVRDSTSAGLLAGLDAGRAAWMTRAVYVDFSRPVGHAASLDAGARASDSTLAQHGALSPWVVGTWHLRADWTVRASAGSSRQFPDLDAVLGAAGSPLKPERATHLDASVEQRTSSGLRWQATVFSRVENDVLRLPGATLPVASLLPLKLSTITVARNGLSGTSRGIELVVTPAHVGAVSGWLSYAFARTRQHDVTTQETFWSDMDRRHTLNAAGTIHLGPQTSAGLVFRAASGLPVPGYFDLRNGALVSGDQLNTVRLPSYVRVDARVQRRLLSARHQITLFGEVQNALNQGAQGLGIAVTQPTIGTALALSPIAPRRVSAGIRIDWSR